MVFVDLSIVFITPMPFFNIFLYYSFTVNFNASQYLRNRIPSDPSSYVHPQFHFRRKRRCQVYGHRSDSHLIGAEAVSVKAISSCGKNLLDLSVLPLTRHFTMVIIYDHRKKQPSIPFLPSLPAFSLIGTSSPVTAFSPAAVLLMLRRIQDLTCDIIRMGSFAVTSVPACFKRAIVFVKDG